MKVTITIEGKQGEGKSTVARDLLAFFQEAATEEFNFNTYLSDNGETERRTNSSYPHSVVITTITTDGESR